MTEAPLRLGTRGSALALAQAKLVAKALGGAEIVPIKTSATEVRRRRAATRPASSARSSGPCWTARSILAVHSAKDLPTELPGGPRDRRRARERGSPGRLRRPASTSLGRVSRRARGSAPRACGAAPRSSLGGPTSRWSSSAATSTRGWRGCEAGDFDGLVLAAAGTAPARPRRGDRRFPIEPDEIVPAPGQGAIAIEALHSNDRAATAAESITDRGRSATAVRRARPGRRPRCELQHAARSECDAREAAAACGIRAFCGLPDGSEWLRDELERGRLRSGGARRSDWRSGCSAAGACRHPGESGGDGGSDDRRARESSTWSARAPATRA